MLRKINLQDPRLTELEAVALAKMIDKFEQYTKQHRTSAAHGCGTAIWILWSTLTEGRNFATGWGALL